MASGGKKKTTMAKLTRESKLRERRLDKQAKRDARKRGLLPSSDQTDDALDAAPGESDQADAAEPAVEVVGQAPDA
jgi:hypothetical protein